MTITQLKEKIFNPIDGIFARVAKLETNLKWVLFIMSGIFTLNIAILGGVISIFFLVLLKK